MSVERIRRCRVALFCLVLSANQAGAQPVAVDTQPPPPTEAGGADGGSVLRKMQDAFETIADRVGPSVVAIRVQHGPGPGYAAGEIGIGSGFVVRPDGLILTCEHVVAEALAIQVTLHDGRRARARVLASDPRADLAVIQTSFRGLRPARLGDASELRGAKIVLAFGFPLGLFGDGQAAVTQGLVSAIGRPLPESFGLREDRYFGDMIQMSAAISPGHSGGPLVDISGRVVGVTTVGVDSRTAGNGIGFALPINSRTLSVIDGLINGKSADYGYLGVTLRRTSHSDTVPEDDSPRRDPRGATLEDVQAGGPAERAGLRAGDALIAINDVEVVSADQCIQIIGAIGAEHPASLRFIRDGKEQTVSVKLVRRLPPPDEPEQDSLSFRGATLAPIPTHVRAMTNLPADALLVVLVAEDSPAARAGLAPGDLVVRIEGVPLTMRSHVILDGLSGDCLVGLANGGSVLVKDDGE